MDIREKQSSEKRLIDANSLLRHKRKMSGADFGGEFWDEAVLISDIKNAPTVDAVEVVHAEWLYDGGSGKYFCSACDADALSFKKDDLYGGDLYEVYLTDYCPSCGAKMDGGAD